MRKVTFGAAISLDHYLARLDGAVDWLLWSDEAAAVMADLWRGIDTVLMGRKTYEFALRLGHGDAMPGLQTFVFSRTLTSGAGKGVTIIAEDAAGFVRDLKQRGGKDILLMGGGELARSLLEAALIDAIEFNVHPVLLGAGVPVFHPMAWQTALELHGSRALKNGCVLLKYRVSRSVGQSVGTR